MGEQLQGLRGAGDEMRRARMLFSHNNCSVNIVTNLLYTNPCTGFAVALGIVSEITSNRSLCVFGGQQFICENKHGHNSHKRGCIVLFKSNTTHGRSVKHVHSLHSLNRYDKPSELLVV
jgi:hypothetical protein